MNVWRLMLHHENPQNALRWTRLNQRIAIGWGQVGHLHHQGYTSPKEISAVVSQLIRDGKQTYRNAGQSGVGLWAFCYTMQKGDLVILNANGPTVVVQVTGDYEWRDDESSLPNYFHQRRIEITQLDPRAIWNLAGARPIKSHSPRWTLIQCEKPVQIL